MQTRDNYLQSGVQMNIIRYFLKKLDRFFNPRPKRIWIFTPPELKHNFGYSNDYHKYKKTYTFKEACDFVPKYNKVRFWKLVHSDDDFDDRDEYVPFFFKFRIKRH